MIIKSFFQQVNFPAKVLYFKETVSTCLRVFLSAMNNVIFYVGHYFLFKYVEKILFLDNIESLNCLFPLFQVLIFPTEIHRTQSGHNFAEPWS